MRFGSLFAGVGGFDLGLEAAGWECGWQVEWDPHCQQTLAHHWPTVPRWGDVATVNGADLPPVDVITFGSPCQDLSVAGKRAGLEGSRSGLFFEATRIIEEMRDATGNTFPRWAIWENVAGAISSNRGADFGRVLKEMDNIGACFSEWRILDAQHFGIPQRRRRIFLVSCFDTDTATRCPTQLLADTPSSTRGDTQVRETRPRNTIRAANKTTGISGRNFYRHKFGGYIETDVLGTLRVSPGACFDGNLILDVDGKVRRITPEECERAMGWPTGHTATGVKGRIAHVHRFKMCGNGVASPVARWIAEQINQAEHGM